MTTNTAQIARHLSGEAAYDLLRIFTDPAAYRKVRSPLLTQLELVNVIDGQATLTEKGARVVRHLDAGHQVQVRGRMLRILERVLAAQTVDGDVERDLARLTPDELDLLATALDRVRAALGKSISR